MASKQRNEAVRVPSARLKQETKCYRRFVCLRSLIATRPAEDGGRSSKAAGGSAIISLFRDELQINYSLLK